MFADAETNDEIEIGALARQVLRILRRHKWWILIPASILFVPALLIPLSLPDVYTAVAAVEVMGRPEILDMDADPLSEGAAGGARRAQASPYASVALSEQVLGSVIVETRSPADSASTLDLPWIQRLRIWLGLRPEGPDQLTPDQELSTRTEELRSRLDVYEENSILKIEAHGSDPVATATLANAVSDALVSHSKARRQDAASEAMSFFNTQVFEYRERIDRRKQEIAELVTRTGIRLDQAEATSEAAMLGRELETTRRQLRDLRLRISMLRERIERPRKSGLDTETSAQQRERLRLAIQELTIARLQYTPSAPQVIRLENLVATLQAQVGSLEDEELPVTPTELEDYRLLQAEERSLAASEAALTREVRESGAFDPEEANTVIEYQRLTRELEIDEQQLRELIERRNRLVFEANSNYATFRVLDYASRPIHPSGPERGRWLLVGVTLAVGLGVGLGVLRELFDQTIREPEEATDALNVAVLGMIPRIHDGTPPERQSDGPPSSLAAESYRNLRTALLFTAAGQEQGSLLVTSAIAGEGKTTVTTNLASSFAQAGKNIVLVDADMRLPRVHKVMGMAPAPGLAELIRGDSDLDEALRRPVDGRFDVITAGRVPPNPSELLACHGFVMLMARLKAMYDLVLIDCPVLLGVSDACIIGAHVDGALLVHRPGSVEKRALVEIRRQLMRAKVNLIGLAFNQVDRNDRHFYPLYMESPYVSKGKGVRARRTRSAG